MRNREPYKCVFHIFLNKNTGFIGFKHKDMITSQKVKHRCSASPEESLTLPSLGISVVFLQASRHPAELTTPMCQPIMCVGEHECRVWVSVCVQISVCLNM